MMPIHSIFGRSVRLAAMVLAIHAVPAFADDYTDVSQLLQANKLTEAMTRANQFLANKPADPQMRFLKGVILRNQDKTAEAIATFTKLTEDYPELPEPFNNLAVLYAGQGRYDLALSSLETAIRTNPSYATAHENMGDVYARLASLAYNKALQLDTNNGVVAPKLALIREVFKPNLSIPRATPGTLVAAANQGNQPIAIAAVAPAPAPAVKPVAAPVVVAAQNVPAKPVPDANNDSASAVKEAVMTWAQAWSDKNMKAYLASYSPEFVTPGKQSRSNWEQDRRSRIVGKSRIEVKVSDLKIAVNGNKAVARFRQSYRGDALKVSSRKSLEMQKIGNQWLITKESTG